MEKSEIEGFIAKRVTWELKDGNMASLGTGLSTLVPAYLPEGVYVILQSENGIIGTGTKPASEEADSCCKTDTDGQPAQTTPFSCYADSVTSFGFIRDDHVGATISGGLEVDEGDSLFNWIIPGEKMPGIGGAMDLLADAEEVVVAMKHITKGDSRILEKCRLPYIAVHCIAEIITEMYVINVTDKGLELAEINPEFTVG